MPGEEPSELQEYTLKCIDDAGGIALVVSSPEEAVGRVQELLDAE